MMTKENRIKALAMFKLVLSDESYENTGKQYGISGARVRQIIANMKRMMSSPQRWEGGQVNFKRKYGIKEMRADKELWLNAIDRMNKEIESSED